MVAVVIEAPLCFRPPLFPRRQRLQNLVVRLRRNRHALLRQPLRERRRIMHVTALFVAIPNINLHPRVHPLPTHLLSPDSQTRRLLSGLRERIRRGVNLDRAPHHQKKSKDHKPSVSGFRSVGSGFGYHKSACVPGCYDQVW